MSELPLGQYDHINHIYSKHHRWLKSWLYTRLNCSEQAADLAQDTFVRLLLKAELISLDEPKAYLTTIAKGLVIDHWRRGDLEKAYKEAVANLPEPYVRSAEETHLTLELLMQISSLLDGMKSKVRMAFLLSQLEGMTYVLIAKKMNVSTRTVERYIADAMYHCYLLRYSDEA